MFSHLFLITAFLTSGLAGQRIDDRDAEYYAVFLEGAKVGHAVMARYEEPNRIVTRNDVAVTVGRDQAQVSMSVCSTGYATLTGRPLGFESEQNLGLMAVQVAGQVNQHGDMEVTITTGGLQQQRTIALADDVLSEEGVDQKVRAAGLKPNVRVQARMFEPMLLQVVDVEVHVGEKKVQDILGQPEGLIEVTLRIRQPQSAVSALMKLPGNEIESREYLRDDGSLRKAVLTHLANIRMELVACDKTFALSSNDVPDFISRFLVKSPRRLTGVDESRLAVYHLRPRGPVTWVLAADGGQTVAPGPDGTLRVTVRPLRATTGQKLPYRGNNPRARAALRPSRFVQSESGAIVKLAQEAVDGTQAADEAAYRIESFVHDYIREKNLSVGYASALEVARYRQGDCTEHAVLTAALCRAVGLPAEVVMGYVYVERFAGKSDVFVGHAWCQVYIDSQWIGLDATRAPHGYSPGHIAQSAGNGAPADFFNLVSGLNTFDIVKIEWE